MPSASVSRPSASVLPISTVVPFIARSTSPGRMAAPEGMFSVAAIRPWTSTCGLSAGSARMMPSTAAAPDMSSFIRSMPSALLRSRPPESKVMPLPMTATFRRLRDGVHARWMESGRRPRQVDQLGRLLAAGGDAEKQAHPELLALRALQHLQLDPAGLGDLGGHLGQVRGMHVVGRRVDEVAREPRGLGEDLAAPWALGRLAPVATVGLGQPQRLHVLVGLLALVAVEGV